MGRPPQNGAPAFRFTPNEVLEMEACLHEANNGIPAREVISSLADKFSASPDRAGKSAVQQKQVWNWFQNRRYAQRAKSVKIPGKLSVSPLLRDDSVPTRIVPHPVPISSGRNTLDNSHMEFEAKSARDGAWYDVSTFISHRGFESGDPEVRVRFSGFGSDEDEWINVKKCVRQRSLPCEAAECVVVLPGDLILCFQEGKEQALYFDAHVLDAQRRRHDVRGCRCRFLVRYDQDLSEEIVPLRKVCRRPETDYRLQLMHASKGLAAVELRNPIHGKDMIPRDFNSTNQKTRKQRKLVEADIDVNADVATIGPLIPHSKEPIIIMEPPAPAPTAPAPAPATAPTPAPPSVLTVTIEKNDVVPDGDVVGATTLTIELGKNMQVGT